jgi:hypothetical protein
MQRIITTGFALATATLLSMAAPDAAQAQPLTLTLAPVGALINVDDAAGRWQHAGGEVICPDGTHIANYALHRRVTFSGTQPQNTAMLTITLFFLGDDPADNITLQGAHSFNNGNSSGSVSAASQAFAAMRKQGFTGSGADDTITINKLGGNRFNPCL